MRNNLIRVPLTVLLVWLRTIGFKQGVSGFLDNRDWSDDYLRSEAVIVDSERHVSHSNTGPATYHSCRLIVEYQFEGETYRKTLVLNLAQGLLFFGLASLLWRRRKSAGQEVSTE